MDSFPSGTRPTPIPTNIAHVDLARLLEAAVPSDTAGHPARAAAVRLDRAGTELRRGRPVALPVTPHAGKPAAGWLLVAAVETLSEALLDGLLQAGSPPRLLLSAERLQALGWPAASTPRALALGPGIGLLPLQQVAAAAAGPGDRGLLGAAQLPEGREHAWQAALNLCKRRQLIPALLVVELDAGATDALAAAQVLTLPASDLALAATPVTPQLRRISDARVPLFAEEDCTLVLFREVDGHAEHVAVLVGQPPVDAPVPVRLHSACLTGDLMGSLRCDCGPQLQRAVAQLARTGGVLLYLAQEGRSTGLANKLRAYRLQDAGLDTLQADRHLGFREDERNFTTAATMLQALGHTRIQLLTNNPHKIAALRAAGIQVQDRLPLHAPVNDHNARYIGTKQRAGHLGTGD